jgi:hypothetical protein
MPASAIKLGQRVVHPKHGPGAITAVSADAVEVEHDVEHDGQTMRRYVLSLCTLTTEAGEPLKPAAQPPVEHPPTDQIHRRPKAIEPKPKDAAMPAKPKNQLLADMEAALIERGPASKSLLAAACGLVPSSLRNWRHTGRIPYQHHDAVAAWIKAPHAQAAKPKAAPVKPKEQLRRVRIPKIRDLQPPPIRSAIDHGTVLKALGLVVTSAWIPDGNTMRLARVAVLPA